jgi:nitrate/nitrite transport system substrate-binding protein
MRRSVLMDGKVWDASDPDSYISSFPIRRTALAGA